MSELVEFLQEEQKFHHERIAALREKISECLSEIDHHNIALHTIVSTYYDLPREEQK